METTTTQTVFRFKVDKLLLKRFSQLADKDSRTTASLIRKLMKEQVTKNGN